jgi:hypothetical protein
VDYLDKAGLATEQADRHKKQTLIKRKDVYDE